MDSDDFAKTARRLRVAVVVLDGTADEYWGSLCRNSGLRSPAAVHEYGELQALLDRDETDCLFFSVRARNIPAVGHAARALRGGFLGRDPFLPLLVAVEHPTGDDLRDLAGGGIDAVLLKPLTPAAILERLNFLTDHRLGFVVTADYIGPDRRRGQRAAATTGFPSLTEVPNSLLDRRISESASPMYCKLREKAWAEIRRRRLDCYAEALSALGARTLPTMAGDDESADARHLARLLADAGNWLSRAGVSTLAENAAGLARDLSAARGGSGLGGLRTGLESLCRDLRAAE